MIGALFDFLKARKELKRFRSIPRPERQIVFYSEGPGYWSHFEPIYSALQKAGQRVLYVTSRHDDPVYQDPPPGIQAFNLGSGVVCTLFFATLDVDVLVMTMPDLNTFHIKRSPYGVHYAYLHHSIVSTHMVYRPGAFDHFDSVFCVGPHHVREIRKREEQEQLPPKILLEHGYGRLDGMLRDDDARPSHEARSILVAPSWGENSLLNLCATELIDNLLDAGHHVILRPHPRSRQLSPKLLEGIERRYKQRSAFALDEDMDAHATLASAGVMISDWSGAALEFAFAYRRPVLFIDVPRKVRNPDYEKLGIEPLEASIRNEIGLVLAPARLCDASDVIKEMLANAGSWEERILAARRRHIFNLGNSGTVAASFLMQQSSRHRERSR